MSEDIKIEGINISALLRNFDKLRKTVKDQGEIIAALKKEQALCFSRIDYLNKQLDKKTNDPMRSDAVSELFGKFGSGRK